LLSLFTLFHDKLLKDDAISYLFTDIAKINLEHHLPVLVDFGDSILFHPDTYRKNAMQPHWDLNKLSSITDLHFDTWLRYFIQSVHELLEGEKAFVAKEKGPKHCYCYEN